MIVYHVDLHGHLSPGMILGLRKDWIDPSGLTLLLQRQIKLLFPGGVSSYGARVLSKPSSAQDALQQSLEIQLELIRRQYFENCPSRFCCAFASRSVESAKRWISTLEEDGAALPIFALECDSLYSADAHLLDFPDTQSYKPDSYPSAMIPSHYGYWSSLRALSPETSGCTEYSPSPVPLKEELLLRLPAHVLYRVM